MSGKPLSLWEILSRVFEDNVDPLKPALRVTASQASVMESGKATSGTTGTIVDTGKSWVVNVFAGMYVKINDGTNAGQMRLIASNTATTITITGTFSSAIDTTSEYVVFEVSAPSGSNVIIVGDTVGLAKEAGGNLASLAGEDFATETTLSALNTKIPASPATEGGNLASIKGKTDNIDILMSALRDAIAGAGAGTKTLADVVTALASVAITNANLDAPLSDLALESGGNLDDIKTNPDELDIALVHGLSDDFPPMLVGVFLSEVWINLWTSLRNHSLFIALLANDFGAHKPARKDAPDDVVGRCGRRHASIWVDDDLGWLLRLFHLPLFHGVHPGHPGIQLLRRPTDAGYNERH